MSPCLCVLSCPAEAAIRESESFHCNFVGNEICRGSVAFKQIRISWIPPTLPSPSHVTCHRIRNVGLRNVRTPEIDTGGLNELGVNNGKQVFRERKKMRGDGGFDLFEEEGWG